MKRDRFRAWAYQQDVSPASCKFVLVTIADMSDNSGVCTASLKRIGNAVGMGRRSVIRYLDDLETQGYLVSMNRRRKNGRQAVNAYCLAPSYLFEGLVKAKLTQENEPDIEAKTLEKILS